MAIVFLLWLPAQLANAQLVRLARFPPAAAAFIFVMLLSPHCCAGDFCGALRPHLVPEPLGGGPSTRALLQVAVEFATEVYMAHLQPPGKPAGVTGFAGIAPALCVGLAAQEHLPVLLLPLLPPIQGATARPRRGGTRRAGGRGRP